MAGHLLFPVAVQELWEVSKTKVKPCGLLEVGSTGTADFSSRRTPVRSNLRLGSYVGYLFVS